MPVVDRVAASGGLSAAPFGAPGAIVECVDVDDSGGTPAEALGGPIIELDVDVDVGEVEVVDVVVATVEDGADDTGCA